MLTEADFKKWHENDGDGDNIRLSRNELLQKVIAGLDFPDGHGGHCMDWSAYCGLEYDDFGTGEERFLELVLEPEFDDHWLDINRMTDAVISSAIKMIGETCPQAKTARDGHILRITV